MWREAGGAAIEVRPMALAYMPPVMVNTFLLLVLFATVAFTAMRGNILGTIEGVSFFGVALMMVALLAQLAIVALVELVSGRRERAALMSAVREALGD